MTVSVTTRPEFAVTSGKVEVSFSVTEAGANYVRLMCSAAPDGSQLRTRLDEAAASQVVEVYQDEVSQTWQFTPDVGGAYTFKAHEMAKGATSYGGGYDGDENGYRTEEKLSSNDVTIYVGSEIETTLGVGQDKAKCRAVIHNATIIKTTKDAHGVTSPATFGATSSKARSASQSSSVTAALALLEGESTATAIGDPEAMCAGLISEYEAHRASTSYHYVADGDNVVQDSFHDPQSPAGLAIALNELRKQLDRHIRNDSAAAGTGTAGYHQASGELRADLGVSILAPPASQDSRLSQLVLIADLRRVVASHKTSGVHQTPDGSGTAALSRILQLHFDFMAEISKAEPDPTSGANPGVTSMIHNGGFKES